MIKENLSLGTGNYSNLLLLELNVKNCFVLTLEVGFDDDLIARRRVGEKTEVLFVSDIHPPLRIHSKHCVILYSISGLDFTTEENLRLAINWLSSPRPMGTLVH